LVGSRSLSARTRVALAMFSVGVLFFLLVDVLAHGFELAEGAVEEFKDGDGSFLHAAGLTLLLLGGFALGSAGLGITERRLRIRTSSVRSGTACAATAIVRSG
jgi:hypothetical protein